MFFRAFYHLRLPLQESNSLWDDVEISFETALGDVCFQVQESDVSDLNEASFLCTATINSSTPEEIEKTFYHIQNEQELNWNPMESIDEFGEFNGDIGSITGVKNLPGFNNIGSYKWIDDSFWEYVLQLKSLLDNSSLNLIDLICWRCGYIGRKPISPSELLSFLWSLDAEQWFQLPLIGVFNDSHEFEVEEFEEKFLEIKDFLDRDIKCPLGINIFQQAWLLRESYPQVSLVTAISAAEVECKRFLVEFNLNDNSDVTLFKIIERLKHPVFIRGTSFCFPPDLVRNLDKGRTIRNRIVHTGNEEISLKDIEPILISIKELLYFIEFLFGHKWCKSFFSLSRTFATNGVDSS